MPRKSSNCSRYSRLPVDQRSCACSVDPHTGSGGLPPLLSSQNARLVGMENGGVYRPTDDGERGTPVPAQWKDREDMR
jgi:hypothetical protein